MRAANPRWTRTLARYAAPLALLPAIAWPIGQGASGWAAAVSFASTLALSLASVLLFAAGAYALASFFEAARDWDRAVAVAAYASTPMFACGALLVVPVLVVASVAGFVHCLALAYLGMQTVLGCKETDAAAFTAGAGLFALVAGLVLGGLCSAVGLI